MPSSSLVHDSEGQSVRCTAPELGLAGARRCHREREGERRTTTRGGGAVWWRDWGWRSASVVAPLMELGGGAKEEDEDERRKRHLKERKRGREAEVPVFPVAEGVV
ncbi:hypothetical protein U1Q18_033645 [Sarracenia purpurea var. burkii]